jgi:hypothetical protein
VFDGRSLTNRAKELRDKCRTRTEEVDGWRFVVSRVERVDDPHDGQSRGGMVSGFWCLRRNGSLAGSSFPGWAMCSWSAALSQLRGCQGGSNLADVFPSELSSAYPGPDSIGRHSNFIRMLPCPRSRILEVNKGASNLDLKPLQ